MSFLMLKSCITMFALTLSLTCLSTQPAMAETHFETRMAAIKKDVGALPSSTTSTIVMLGDSITEGFFTAGAMPEKILGLPVVDEGIGGDVIGTTTSTVGVVSRLEQVKQAKPAIVFVMIGINNLWDPKTPAESTIEKYEQMVPLLKAAAPNAKLVFESVLPTTGKMNYVNPKVLQLNARIKELASKNGAAWLDLHSLMKNDKGELNPDFTKDGVHLKGPAFDVWLKALQETASQILK